MYIFLSVMVIIIVLISLFGTLFVGKEVNGTIKKLEGIEGEEEQEELLKAGHFKNHKRNLAVLTIIYAVTFFLAIIAIVIYFKTT
ncbi:hypothetical protein EV207_11661 [Scopulibacillus darangshiensis]|uniref:Uncharacterized protein n=1 Tax=Scopulibacillus darangshiensis TaxID=442528 RepID=A0A4R2P211_9BACL|nr:hypothetical protein [Scopulibacillus darangshiensis]TCP28749.1 hypothetical protein EV207_11661 [Scopulibacillus darangshiensis]